MSAQVRVGVGVFLLESTKEPVENPRILIGKRVGSHGSGTYSLAGGHMEFGETPEECASRELLEETGLRASSIQFLTATNDYMPAEGKHYVTLWVACVREDEKQPPRVLEPDKCEGWEWVSWDDLRSWAKREIETTRGDEKDLGRRLFLPLLNLVRQRPNMIPSVV